MNYERPVVHQSGSYCFQKCVHSKLKNSGKTKTIQVLESSCLQKDPEQLEAPKRGKDMEIQGPVPRETDS